MKAVNGAGENASPSNNVSIPSLPAIGPVTASLIHQVWKYDGEIRVNVSFQVRNNNTTNIDSRLLFLQPARHFCMDTIINANISILI